MDRNDFLDARRYQLELVLIGFAMATSGSRKEILRGVSDDDMGSVTTRTCMAGIRSKDAEAVRASIASLGVDIQDGEAVHEALMRTIKEMRRQKDIRESVGEVMANLSLGNLADAEERLEAVLEFLRTK